MKKVPVQVILAFLFTIIVAVAGCAGTRISGPDYQPPVPRIPSAVSEFLQGKEVSITAQNDVRGIIVDVVLQADGVPIERRKAEVDIRAEILRDSSSGYHSGYSPVPLVPSGPAYRVKVNIWISQNGAVRFHGVGAESYFHPGSISRTLATERAVRYALANLRGARTIPR